LSLSADTRRDVKLAGAGAIYGQTTATDEEHLELGEAAASFRRFLDYWYFVDGDTGVVRCLGKELWEAQEEFVAEAMSYDWVYFLKARQLGETTIGCAFDGWVMRFRDDNARVHMFSRQEKAAQSLLERVKFGLERLPEWWKLPVVTSTMSEYHIRATEDDVRRGIAYPADNDTARGETCTHAHIDEWAFMGNPAKVWQAIMPSAAKTVHFLTTGQGPQNYSSTFWRKCLAGDIVDRRGEPIRPIFIHALKRPDRTDITAVRASAADEQTGLVEYPMTWEDALSGGGDFVFKSSDMDKATTYARGFSEPKKGRKYVKAWDIGRHKDAAVGICLDITEDCHDVVAYVRLREQTYPMIQQAIEEMHLAYPGITAVEGNAAGEAVIENLDLPEHAVQRFSTTAPSKARILQHLRFMIEKWLIRWDGDECHQLDAEMRGYQLPDNDVVQDSVMTLAIAEEYVIQAHMLVGHGSVLTFTSPSE
jgi:Terminase RNaseH-like domain